MPNLIMPPSSFSNKERVILSNIINMHSDLIDKIGEIAEVCVIGRSDKDDEFWNENVLNDDKEIIDPFDGLPVLNNENLTHFCVVSIKPWNNQELYFGNNNFELSEFVRVVLIRVQRISASIDSKKSHAV